MLLLDERGRRMWGSSRGKIIGGHSGVIAVAAKNLLKKRIAIFPDYWTH